MSCVCGKALTCKGKYIFQNTQFIGVHFTQHFTSHTAFPYHFLQAFDRSCWSCFCARHKCLDKFRLKAPASWQAAPCFVFVQVSVVVVAQVTFAQVFLLPLLQQNHRNRVSCITMPPHIPVPPDCSILNTAHPPTRSIAQSTCELSC